MKLVAQPIRLTSRSALSLGLMATASLAVMTIASGAHAATAAAEAGTDVGELTVTARLIEEDVQDVPQSVTVLTTQDLVTQNIKMVQDLQFHSPSLRLFNNYNHTVAAYQIRGLNAGTTTYFSEAPGGPGAAGVPFYDISSIQVLNGPQGTLFGRQSTAGSILITPQHPVMNQWGGFVEGTAGDYGRMQLTGVVNLPLVEDTLALRVAATRNHVDGFTSLIGPAGIIDSEKLDETNNYSLRIGLEAHFGRFKNYAVFNYVDIDQTPAAQVLKAANPNVALFNLPASIPVVTALANTFQCPTAVAIGQAPDLLTCQNQRLGLLARIRPILVAEAARVAPGGDAVRFTPVSYDGLPNREQYQHFSFIDVAQLDVGALGAMHVSFKNIFSYQGSRSTETQIFDGIGGVSEEAAAQLSAGGGSSNQIGTQAYAKLGPWPTAITEEFQFHGDVSDGLLNVVAGVYYSRAISATDLEGVPNLFKVYSGVLQPNLGYSIAFDFPVSGKTEATSLYGNMILDLSRLGIHGLHIAGGAAKAWDSSSSVSRLPVIDFVTGHISPGVTRTGSSSSDGYSWNVSVDEAINDDFMIYATARRGYRPGGFNAAAGCALVPQNGCPPQFGPETVKDAEFGFKADFRWGDDIKARLNAAYYHTWYSNIIVGFSTLVGAQSVPYSKNAAAAEIQGLELTGNLMFGNRLELIGTYAYIDDGYTEFISSDPFNQAQPGNAVCLPSSPAGTCLLDLSGEEFPLVAKHSGSITARYHLPLDENLGEINLIGTIYSQSRQWLIQTPHRIAQLSGQAIADKITQPAMTKIDARVEWNNIKGSNVSAALWVNNATNVTYGMGGVFQLYTFGIFTEIYQPPRMWGLEVSYKFGG